MSASSEAFSPLDARDFEGMGRKDDHSYPKIATSYFIIF